MLDSVDKIITTYFSSVTKQAFTYKKRTYTPMPLRVSPLIFRGFRCNPGCAGCCKPLTLDYLPSDELPYPMRHRLIVFNGNEYYVYSDTQKDTVGTHCKHVDKQTGYCGIHGKHPFSCDFELLRFHIGRGQKPVATRLSHVLFGRGWQMLRVDGQRGALCEMLPAHRDEIPTLVRKLNRLKEWTDWFGLETVIPDITLWCRNGPHETPLYLNQEFTDGIRRVELPVFGGLIKEP